ncbi:MAG TPA: hypothetical protein VKU44_10315 [Terriglobia bacterium]|nr:hypothetical protein [Terriglobia bacterium]
MKNAKRWEVKRGLLSAAVLAAMALGASASALANEVPVTGFRGAQFGTDEKAVIEAAKKDLKVDATAIQKTQDPMGRITTLSVKVPDFPPLNLPATVNYVLGYKCACLVQVNIGWTFPASATNEQRTTAMAGVVALVNRFASRPWDNDKAVVNRAAGQVAEGSENALIFFHGENLKGSAITLLGGPVKMTKTPANGGSAGDKKAESASKVGGAASALAADVDAIRTVTLLYEKDAAHPDIYRPDADSF